MRNTVVFLVSFALVACMEKQPDGTYRILKTDTAKARTNAARAGEGVKKATDEIANSPMTQKLRAGARALGRKAQEGLGKAAVKAGEKLKDAGAKAQADANKH